MGDEGCGGGGAGQEQGRAARRGVGCIGQAGYDAFTIDAVASRAGTSRPVIYRRWRPASARHYGHPASMARRWGPVPDTGTLRGDLSRCCGR
ncbi:MAG: helix-turn-helix domain-containing protein [Thermomicrobiales bacterium]